MENQHSGDDEKYEKKCETCNFIVRASRKYGAMQILQKHKETCKSCPECKFTGRDNKTISIHLRDQHGMFSESTSPPLKRKKKMEEITVSEEEPMDIEDVKDLSTSFEEMEIDNKEAMVMKDRRKKMDAKVLEKQKSADIDDFLRKRREVLDEKKRKEEEERSIIKKANKKRKQSEKDARKRKNKKNKTVETSIKYKVPKTTNIWLRILLYFTLLYLSQQPLMI